MSQEASRYHVTFMVEQRVNFQKTAQLRQCRASIPRDAHDGCAISTMMTRCNATYVFDKRRQKFYMTDVGLYEREKLT
ncbi:hypothetical protein EUGRSUZ_K00160 [Eucalyptus grandis]|uniref:Uncharacterized protein n=2 Tax=Eucalyptus grandis TaxID=71139 RepID=A0ACC3IQU2_EUCGR|nr:hypothetical protein EUGRSUZ_K00160 [Eucalyptus grandis]